LLDRKNRQIHDLNWMRRENEYHEPWSFNEMKAYTQQTSIKQVLFKGYGIKRVCKVREIVYNTDRYNVLESNSVENMSTFKLTNY